MALVSLALLLASLYLGVGMSADLVTDGATGISQEFGNLGGLLLIIGLVALGMARKVER